MLGDVKPSVPSRSVLFAGLRKSPPTPAPSRSAEMIALEVAVMLSPKIAFSSVPVLSPSKRNASEPALSTTGRAFSEAGPLACNAPAFSDTVPAKALFAVRIKVPGPDFVSPPVEARIGVEMVITSVAVSARTMSSRPAPFAVMPAPPEIVVVLAPPRSSTPAPVPLPRLTVAPAASAKSSAEGELMLRLLKVSVVCAVTAVFVSTSKPVTAPPSVAPPGESTVFASTP